MERKGIYGAVFKNNHLSVCTLLLYSVLLVAYAFANVAVIANNKGTCGDERTKWGHALLNHTYKGVHADNFASCLLECNQDRQCKSFNFWWNILKCEFNNVTKYSEPKSFICKVNCVHRDMLRTNAVTLYRSCNEVHPSCGDGSYSIDPTSSGDPFPVYCDMTTDGGGWTAIRRLTLQDSDLAFSTDWSNPSSYRKLSQDYRRVVRSAVLLQLRQDMGYSQFRFYCYKKSVGTVFHIMTNTSPQGEAVVQYFTDDSLVTTRPQACASYTVLPDDNSTLSKDCTKWGWDGNRVDQKWTNFQTMGVYRVFLPMVRRPSSKDRHGFGFYPNRRDCDDYRARESSLSPGDTWALYVR